MSTPLFDKITSKLVTFLLEIYHRGYVTSNTQHIFKGTSYYFTIWDLRDMGILEPVGIHNGRKAWKLTKKGEELVKLLAELRAKGLYSFPFKIIT